MNFELIGAVVRHATIHDSMPISDFDGDEIIAKKETDDFFSSAERHARLIRSQLLPLIGAELISGRDFGLRRYAEMAISRLMRAPRAARAQAAARSPRNRSILDGRQNRFHKALPLAPRMTRMSSQWVISRARAISGGRHDDFARQGRRQIIPPCRWFGRRRVRSAHAARCRRRIIGQAMPLPRQAKIARSLRASRLPRAN